MKALNVIALILVVVGALNWGLIGFFRFDLVHTLLGGSEGLSRIVYAIVGLAGLWSFRFFAACKCMNGSCSCNRKDK